jgi:Family of unknown function (DUF6252)
MKPRIILSIVILPLLMLSMQQCNEDEPLTELEKLPPATQSGKRTFGCLVDGKAWVIDRVDYIQADYQLGTLTIFAEVNNSIYSYFSFRIIDSYLDEKTYALTEFPNQFARYDDFNGQCTYYTTAEYNGSVTITHLDRTRGIISGTFAFETYSKGCSKVVRVTDGRFDIHYPV